MRIDSCSICGRPKDEHHRFSPIRAPRGCKCDPREWEDPTNVPAVCRKYVPAAGGDSVCATCEHDEECHATPKETTP